MWFMFFEIFVLIALSFLVGAGVAALGVRVLVRGSDEVASDAGEVKS